MEQVEDVLAARKALAEAEGSGRYAQLDSAVEAFFSAASCEGSKRIVEVLESTLLTDEAEALLELHAAHSRNDGDQKAVKLFQAHRQLLAQCRRDGIEMAFAHAKQQGPDAFGWAA